MPACVRVPSRRVNASRADATVPARFQLAADAPRTQRKPYVRGSRSSNHESRVTNHSRSGAPPATPPSACSGPPPPDNPAHLTTEPPTACRPQQTSQRQPCRRHRACSIPACRRAADTTPASVRGSRSSNHESRVTNHESQPFRPSLVRGDAPRNAPLCMPACVRVPSSASVSTSNASSPAVPTPPCPRDSSLPPAPAPRTQRQPPPTRRRHDANVRGSRSSNHELRTATHDSRLTTHESRPRLTFDSLVCTLNYAEGTAVKPSPQAVAFLPRGVSFFLSLKRILHRGERAHVR